MSTNQLGIRNSNIIVPYTAATKRTKEVALSLSGTNYSSTSFASGVAFADSAGVWRISLNINANTSSSSSGTIVISGVSFSGSQVVASLPNGGSSSAYTTNGNGTITWSSTANSTNILLSETLLLASKPTWADANMEGVLPVDVYIPPASAGIAGLVNNVAGNTAGTPILGKTDGVAVAAGYVGEVIEYVGTSSFTMTTPSSGTAQNVTSALISVPKGIWKLEAYGTCQLFCTAHTGWSTMALSISSGGSDVLAGFADVVDSGTLRSRGFVNMSKILNLTAASTSYQLQIFHVDASGSPTGINVALIGGATSPFVIKATRIA